MDRHSSLCRHATGEGVVLSPYAYAYAYEMPSADERWVATEGPSPPVASENSYAYAYEMPSACAHPMATAGSLGISVSFGGSYAYAYEIPSARAH